MIPAAGMGLRLGARGPKALVELAGIPMLVRTLRRFEPLGLLEGAIIVVPSEYRALFLEVLGEHFPHHAFTVIDGGEERQASVENGLAHVGAATEIVVIHDAARPFIAPDSIQASIEAAAEFGAATVAIPSADTILVADDADLLQATPDRRRLWACQTPQTFQLETIRSAHEAARRVAFIGTDDASLVRRAGGRVKLVPGTALNFKVTTPADLDLAECVVKGGLA